MTSVWGAVMITGFALGPAIALLLLSWRAVVAGALSIGAVFLFFVSIMAAGNTAWQPGSGNPYLIVAAGWTIAAVLAFAAFWIARKGPGIKTMNVVLAYFALAWGITMRQHVENAWWVVGHPERPHNSSKLDTRN